LDQGASKLHVESQRADNILLLFRRRDGIAIGADGVKPQAGSIKSAHSVIDALRTRVLPKREPERMHRQILLLKHIRRRRQRKLLA